MARPPKPERKNELLDNIVEFLLDKSFASLSFRTLADGLGISSYVLGHFKQESVFSCRNRSLQRLEFEAAVQDSVSPNPRGSALRKFEFWHSLAADWLENQGLQREAAGVSARLFVSSLYGLQYDYVLNKDGASVERALHLLMDRFFSGLDQALAASGSGDGTKHEKGGRA